MKPFTAFAQNVGLVRFPNVKSRYVATVAGLILLHLGCFPKRAALVVSMPLPVPGGAGHVRFGTGAAAGIQTPSKVNLAANGNLVIGASGVIPSAEPGFYDEFPEGVRIVLESGITAASVAAILLNLLFHIVGAREEWRPTSVTAEAAPTSSVRKRFSEGSYGATVPKKMSVEEASNLDREEFIERFGSLYERSPWVAEGAWRERPFTDLSEMHAAFVTTVRDAPPERRLGLIRAHPDLAGKAAVAGELTPESTREQASAGLDRLSPGEYEAFTRLNDAYKEKFGFPMIFAVKENTKETILSGVEARLGNSRPQELEAALGEITKIGFFRLQELVRPKSQEATGGPGVGEP